MELDLDNLILKLEDLKNYLNYHKDNRNYYYDHAIYKNKPLDSFMHCNNQLIELKDIVKTMEGNYLDAIGEKTLETLSNDELDKVLSDLSARSERQAQLIDQLKSHVQQIDYLKIN